MSTLSASELSLDFGQPTRYFASGNSPTPFYRATNLALAQFAGCDFEALPNQGGVGRIWTLKIPQYDSILCLKSNRD